VRIARLILVLALATVIVACGGSLPAGSGQSGPGSSPTVPSVTEAPPVTSPATTPGPSTDAATGEPSEAPATESPTVDVTEAPATPGQSGSAGAAEACSGSDANRAFFAQAAGAVDWPVMCAVLPKGWFVSEGSYRKANGGKLLISYKGPGGATLSLSEGSFCTADDGCVPAGGDLGDAALGSLGGTLVGLDDGGFAIVVNRGASPSWLMVTQGLDQPTTLALGDALAEVAD
jgi:hypothetical protein